VALCVVNSVPVWGFCFRFVPFLPVPGVRQPRGNAHFIGISGMHRPPPELRNGCALSAWRGRDALVEGVGVLYLQFAPPDRPPMGRKARIIRGGNRLRPTGLQAIY
jgi:hypothetical protein